MENLIINKIYIAKQLGDVNKFLIPCINTRCKLNVHIGYYTWIKIEYLFDNEAHMITIPYMIGCNMDIIEFASKVIRLSYLEYNSFSSAEIIHVRNYMCDKCGVEKKIFSVFTIVALIILTYPYVKEDELIVIIG